MRNISKVLSLPLALSCFLHLSELGPMKVGFKIYFISYSQLHSMTQDADWVSASELDDLRLSLGCSSSFCLLFPALVAGSNRHAHLC